MMIGNKLYLGFGAILAVMLALFFLSILTVTREHRTRSIATDTLSDMQTIESIRYEVLIEGLELRSDPWRRWLIAARDELTRLVEGRRGAKQGHDIAVPKSRIACPGQNRHDGQCGTQSVHGVVWCPSPLADPGGGGGSGCSVGFCRAKA